MNVGSGLNPTTVGVQVSQRVSKIGRLMIMLVAGIDHWKVAVAERVALNLPIFSTTSVALKFTQFPAMYFSFVFVFTKSLITRALGIRLKPIFVPAFAPVSWIRYTKKSTSCVAVSAAPVLHQFVPSVFVVEIAAVMDCTVFPILTLIGSATLGSVPARVFSATVKSL